MDASCATHAPPATNAGFALGGETAATGFGAGATAAGTIGFATGGAAGLTVGAGVNAVTAKAFCPQSKQPELKHAAVRIAKAELPWKLAAFGFPMNADDALALRDAVRAWAATMDYASVVLIGGERAGILLRAAAVAPAAAATLDALDRLFGLDREDVVRYDDPKRAIGRRLRIEAERLRAVRLSGDVAAEAWLRDYLVEGADIAKLRSMLLLPSASAPRGHRLRGRIVCNCYAVNEAAIGAEIAACTGPPEGVLAAIQTSLRCGTNCGSCVPELRQMIARDSANRGRREEAA